jgi:hypothetical protein
MVAEAFNEADGELSGPSAARPSAIAPHVIKPPQLPVSATCLPQKAMVARGKRSRWAVGLYVFGFIAIDAVIAKDSRSLGAAFLVAAGTMGDIRISRRPSPFL